MRKNSESSIIDNVEPKKKFFSYNCTGYLPLIFGISPWDYFLNFKNKPMGLLSEQNIFFGYNPIGLWAKIFFFVH